MYMYIYIYIYTHVCMCVYIYIYIYNVVPDPGALNSCMHTFPERRC